EVPSDLKTGRIILDRVYLRDDASIEAAKSSTFLKKDETVKIIETVIIQNSDEGYDTNHIAVKILSCNNDKYEVRFNNGRESTLEKSGIKIINSWKLVKKNNGKMGYVCSDFIIEN
ncbi:MAG: hypothetical protein KDE33_28485, partial [Bacteroidetes bacterium]|nr:hypothetical protein [Bacteroidota bacterium]